MYEGRLQGLGSFDTVDIDFILNETKFGFCYLTFTGNYEISSRLYRVLFRHPQWDLPMITFPHDPLIVFIFSVWYFQISFCI